MESRKNYFALVDAKVVTRLKRRDEQDNGAYETPISEIFESYNIPPEFQKFIIKLNINSVLSDSDAFEYISGYKIDFINTRKIVEGANLVGFGCKRATLVFRFLLEMVNNEVAMAFYDKLVEEGYFDSYLKAIREIFGRDLSNSRKFMGRIRKIIRGQRAAVL